MKAGRPPDQRRPRRARRRAGAARGARVAARLAGAALDVFGAGALLRARCSRRRTSSSRPHLAASTDEAQDRAGVIVAEQVVGGARGRPRHERRQHPDRRRRGPRGARARSCRSRPSLGRFALALARGEPATDHARVLRASSPSYDTRLLTVAALNGAFRGRVDQPVNYVNAPLVAAERGIEVVEQRRRSSPRLHEPDRRRGRRGARRRDDDRHRPPPLARLGARLRDRDRAAPRAWSCSATTTCPGVIGRVGTLLGEAGVNIANMAVSRNRESGQGADGALARHAGLARGARAPRARASTTSTSSAMGD